jgi:hypothetical protein
LSLLLDCFCGGGSTDTRLFYIPLARNDTRQADMNRQEQVGAVTEDVVEFVKGLSVLKTYNMTEKQFFKTKNRLCKAQSTFC